MTSTDVEVLSQPVAPLRPLAVGSVIGALTEYRDLCDRILDDADWQEAEKGKKFLKRCGWRKLALGFGVSTDLDSEHVERDDKGRVLWAEFRARAVAANGRYAVGVGYCDRYERRFRTGVQKDHDIIATASTRAINRACADLFGLGAVSAEEVESGGDTGAPLASSPAADGACAVCEGTGTKRLASGSSVPCPSCRG